MCSKLNFLKITFHNTLTDFLFIFIIIVLFLNVYIYNFNPIYSTLRCPGYSFVTTNQFIQSKYKNYIHFSIIQIPSISTAINKSVL